MTIPINEIVSILFAGVAYAMVLFIISVGLSVTMGLMGFVNLAHGAFAMVGGYAAVTLMRRVDVPFELAVVLAFVIVAAISTVFERVLYRRLYNAPELDQVLLTIGLVFMSIATVTMIWGTDPQNIQVPQWLTGQTQILGRGFPTYRLFLIVVGSLLMIGLWLGFERTRIGAQIRAAVDNRRMAESVGVDVDKLFAITFAIGSGLAGAGGALGASVFGVNPGYALQYLVFFLLVVSVGGLGSLRGAFLAALLLGVIDTAGKYYMPQGGGFFIYAAAIMILLLRPAGLFGKQT